MNQRKISINIGIGTTSLLAVFVILCIVAFAILTFSTAENDKALAEKTANATTEYYVAQSVAEENLAQAVNYIALGDATKVKNLGIIRESVNNGILLKWSTPVNPKKNLLYEVLVKPNGKIVRNTHTVMEL
ncbi:MAG: hypothetical protein RSB05_03100 [Clostridiales bacterium]